jgi:hypothetical protein
MGYTNPLLPEAMLGAGKYKSLKLNPLPVALLKAIILDTVFAVY